MKKFEFVLIGKVCEVIAADNADEAIDWFQAKHGAATDVQIVSQEDIHQEAEC
jgi:hypothetical protein